MYIKCNQLMKNHYDAYGGLSVIFSGDFSQLVPVRKAPVYDDYCAEFQGSVNCFIELDGQWRFKEDPEWGDSMLSFREGTPTLEDIQAINDNCLVSTIGDPPSGTQIATFKNRNRDAINSAIFEEYCHSKGSSVSGMLLSAVMVFMDGLEMKDGQNTYIPVMSNSVKGHFYQNCGENACHVTEKVGFSRVDPVLKLYKDCPLMLVVNRDVINGEANGSRVCFEGLQMKVGEEAFPLKLQCGTTIRGVYASQVEKIIVRHEQSDIVPQVFEVRTDTTHFTATIKIGTEELKAACIGTQFPLVSNSCTTGHKLQGCSCDGLLVNEWHYGGNWVYVVLSRVRTRKGLWIRVPLDTDLEKYLMPENMHRMLQTFRDQCSLDDISDEEYETLLKDTRFYESPKKAQATPDLN
jgi:hypothetical protein